MQVRGCRKESPVIVPVIVSVSRFFWNNSNDHRVSKTNETSLILYSSDTQFLSMLHGDSKFKGIRGGDQLNLPSQASVGNAHFHVAKVDHGSLAQPVCRFS